MLGLQFCKQKVRNFQQKLHKVFHLRVRQKKKKLPFENVKKIYVFELHARALFNVGKNMFTTSNYRSICNIPRTFNVQTTIWVAISHICAKMTKIFMPQI